MITKLTKGCKVRITTKNKSLLKYNDKVGILVNILLFLGEVEYWVSFEGSNKQVQFNRSELKVV